MTEHMEVTNDFIFKAIFGKKGHESVLKALVESILGISIEEIEIIENTRLERELPSQKVGILDIRARLQDGTKINIEMQVINKRDILERTLFYWSKLYVLGMDKGDEYIDMPKTITINILDYHFLPQDEFCLASHLYFDKHREEKITDKLEIYFVDLKKFKKIVKKVDSRLAAWLSFIEGGNKKMIEEAKSFDEEIEKAEKMLKELEENREIMEIIELRRKYVMDSASEKATGRAEGRAEGLAEGIAKGLAKGRAEGIAHGLAEGQEKTKKEKLGIAKKLLKKGLSIKEISEITELSEKEISIINRSV